MSATPRLPIEVGTAVRIPDRARYGVVEDLLESSAGVRRTDTGELASYPLEDLLAVEDGYRHVIALASSIEAAERFVDGPLSYGRCHLGARYGGVAAITDHAVAWRTMSGASSTNVRCPLHVDPRTNEPARLDVTTRQLRRRTLIVTPAYVATFATAAKSAKATAEAELIAAGKAKRVRDLEPGDVIHRLNRRQDFPNGKVLTVARTGAKVTLTLTGTLADYVAGAGTYWSAQWGASALPADEQDLYTYEPVLTVTLGAAILVGTDAGGAGYSTPLVGPWAADDVDEARRALLTKRLEGRREYLPTMRAELVKVEAELADPARHAAVTQSVERFVEYRTRRAEELRQRIAASELTIARLEGALLELEPVNAERRLAGLAGVGVELGYLSAEDADALEPTWRGEELLGPRPPVEDPRPTVDDLLDEEGEERDRWADVEPCATCGGHGRHTWHCPIGGAGGPLDEDEAELEELDAVVLDPERGAAYDEVLRAELEEGEDLERTVDRFGAGLLEDLRREPRLDGATRYVGP